MQGLIIDLFAGGGGASAGIEAALDQPVDLALNHDEIALAVHRLNHPKTRHLEADIWDVRPRKAVGSRRVGLLWASPDCTHFSIAKGGKPRRQNIRSLAWAVVRWAQDVRPDVILLENVREFRDWGPLDEDGHPIKERLGEIFHRWRRRLEGLGYEVDYRLLDSADFGAPTRRRRLFLVARRDGLPIIWPEPTHGPGKLPYRTAAECIDWELPCPSIFERKRPLAKKTLWRIAQGIRRYILEHPDPFLVEMNHSNAPRDLDRPLGVVTTQGNRFNLVTPHLTKFRADDRTAAVTEPLPTITAGSSRTGRPAGAGHALGLTAATLVQVGYGERPGQAARVPGLEKPLGTVVAGGGKHAQVLALLKNYGGVVGQEIKEPASTITAKDHHSLAAATLVKLRGQCAGADPREPSPTLTAGGTHVAEVRAFLTAFYGSDGTAGKGQDLRSPARTLTAKARLGIVTIRNVDYQIVDVGMRMLQPHELLRAQFGRFAEGYDLSAAKTKAAKVRLIGNSVCPEVAEALVRANFSGVDRQESAA